MTSDRQRKLVADFLAESRRGRVEQLMSRPVAAARRYAEAAFEVALADDQLDRWQEDLALAAEILGRPDVEPTSSTARRSRSTSAWRSSRQAAGAPDRPRAPCGSSPSSSSAAGRMPCPRVSEEYTRLLNAHRGVVMATVTSAVPLTADETAAIRSRVEAMAGSRVDLRTEVERGPHRRA